jgi:peptide/nickel transport system ATP-binding protein
MPLVRYMCTRVAVMRHGKVVELDETLSLCANPHEEYTRQLIAATPELPVCAA